MACVFLSYSHADEALRDQLENHLSGLKRQGVISIWHDRRVGAGEELHGQIHARLDEAEIILLLVSSDFIASDYCFDIEVRRAMERHEAGSACVIPVILRPCDWSGTPFRKLQAIPRDGKPIVKHATLDDGFLDVVQAIRGAVDRIKGDSDSAIPAPVAAPGTASDSQLRSSNLRIRRRFSDRDRHTFVMDALETIGSYFENSLNELEARNEGVETHFRRIDVNRFEARAFVGGQQRSRCGIWMGDEWGSDGLFFSFGGVGRGNSYNESMSVEDDGTSLFLKPLGMASYGQHRDRQFTQVGAAEYFWGLFIEQLRQSEEY